MSYPFDIPLDELRRRRSAKWSHVEPDVLPAWVAEMDVRLADPITDALHTAIDLGDTGYAGDPSGAVAALAGFTADRWGWSIDPTTVRVHPDVRVAAIDVLRTVIEPGDGVVICPPVYNNFFDWVPDAGGTLVEVPLVDVDSDTHGRLDLDGLDRAFAAGAKALILSSPHNPLGRVFARDELADLAALAHRHGVVVLADEVHAPLTHPGVEFTAWMTVGDDARACGVALESASKSWNLAGLKCAFAVTEREDVLAGLLEPGDTWAAGNLGLLAAEVAFRDGRDWLDQATAELAARSRELGDLLAEHLPQVGYRAPQASYLAWLDISRCGLGAEPGVALLERGRLSISAGPWFGAQPSHMRLNIGTSPELLAEYVRRLAAVVSLARSR